MLADKGTSPNDRNEPVAGAYGLLNHVNKIQAGPDGIDIHEDLALAKVVYKVVVNPASIGSTIVTPVADEDLRHNPPSFGNDYGIACGRGIVRRG